MARVAIQATDIFWEYKKRASLEARFAKGGIFL